jgi:ribosome maturation protein SDO1
MLATTAMAANTSTMKTTLMLTTTAMTANASTMKTTLMLTTTSMSQRMTSTRSYMCGSASALPDGGSHVRPSQPVATPAYRSPTLYYREAFGTANNDDCLKAICTKGHIQETAAERKEKTDQRRAEVVNYIHKYFINPQNNMPHPITRIELAMDQQKCHIDLDTPIDRVIEDVRKKLIEVLALKKASMDGELTVPHQHVGSVAGTLHKYVEKHSERYTADGCVMEIGIVPGDYDAFLAEMNRITKGEFQFSMHGAAAAAAASGEDDAGGRPGGKGGKQGGKQGGKGKK